ncbi:MAG TPA: PxKF domain-containing protein, partial [Nitriliruptorales bacterium]
LAEGHYEWREANDPFEALAGNTLVVDTEGVHRIDIVAPDGSRVDDLVIAIDLTAPTIDLRSPEDGAGYPYDATVVADYDCSAFGPSGFGGCVGDVDSGTTLPRVVGPDQTFSVVATDGAGNRAEVTHTYTRFAPPIEFDGFYSPLVNGVWNEWDVSSQDSVPFKWRLYRAGELIVDTSVVTGLWWQPVTCAATPAGADPIGARVAAQSADGLGIQILSRRMQYEAASLAAGTCARFDLELDDGSVHHAWLAFVKKK